MTELNKKTLIIGGGMAGLNVAAHLANLGLSSVIVEKESSPGGHIKDHHNLFPHQQKAAEILNEKLEHVQNKNEIKIFTNTVLKNVTGKFGAFNAELLTSENSGSESSQTVEVGAIVIATGFEGMDPNNIYEYGYSLHKNIITGLEFEKMVHDKEAAGEKFGKPSDGSAPKSATIIMCTGSRDEKHNQFCCEVGCRAGLNHANYLKETFGEEISVFVCYIDIRATGKDNEDFYRKVREMDVRFIKSRPSEISPVDEHYARFNVFDLITHKLLQVEADLIILETAIIPRPEQAFLNDLMELTVDDTGFLASSDYYRPWDSSKPGIYFAGTATGPKDLPNTMNDAAQTASQIAKALK